MRTITQDQLHDLIHEVVSTIVSQFLAQATAYDRETNTPDFTAQWDSITNEIAPLIATVFKHVTTLDQAENQLTSIGEQARKEMIRRLSISDTDFNMGQAEAWDHWLNRMQEENWGDDDGYYCDQQFVGDSIEHVLDEISFQAACGDKPATIELRLRNLDTETWTVSEFTAKFK